MIGEVAAEEQEIRELGDHREQRLESALRSPGAVQIGDGRDTHTFFRRGRFFRLTHRRSLLQSRPSPFVVGHLSFERGAAPGSSAATTDNRLMTNDYGG